MTTLDILRKQLEAEMAKEESARNQERVEKLHKQIMDIEEELIAEPNPMEKPLAAVDTSNLGEVAVIPDEYFIPENMEEDIL